MNSENNVYYKAEVTGKKPKIYIFLMIAAILCVIVYVLAFIPVKKEKEPYTYIETTYKEGQVFGKTEEREGYFIYSRNIYGDELETCSYNDEGVLRRFYDDSRIIKHFGWYVWTTAPVYVIIGLFLIFLLVVILRSNSKKCSLELNQDGVFGCKKTLFSNKSINQPFEKIDSIYQKNGLIDKVLGGQTIMISSASSKIRFLCIANAQEFVDKTLEELKKYKESVASTKEKAPASSESDAMDALLKLKSLLDQGLISQEEFEEKRKSLAEKI